MFYLIRWKGFDRSEDTWEPEANLKGTQALQDYKKSLKKTIRTIDTYDADLPVILKRDSTLQVQLVGGKLPTRTSDNAAGLDLYASEPTTIAPHARSMVPTGIKIQLPLGTYGRIAPRSILSTKGIDVAAGVVDRDHTEEIKVLLTNSLDQPLNILRHDRIAQLIVERIATVDIEQVEQLKSH